MLSNLNNHVLAILDKCKRLNHLKQLQAFLITLGHSKTQFFVFKLVRFCTVKLSNITYARLIFDHLDSPNSHLYTAMITAYTSLQDHHTSLFLYREMVRNSQERPNHFIFPIVLKSSPVVVRPYGTEMVHSQIESSGFGKYQVVETALLDAYSRFSADIQIARKLFDGMSERTVVTWTAMISGYTRVGQIGDAILLFEEMSECERDPPFWNSIIAGCTQNGLFSEAISFFRRMVLEENMSRRNRPDQVTVLCALSACGHSGLLQLGKSIHGYVYRNSLSLNKFVSNALVDVYGKCGSLKEARRVFDQTQNPTLTSWNSMINCYALHGKSESAISVFEEMLECADQVEPDGVTFVGLLNACTHVGLVEQGRHYYDMMVQRYGIEPKIEHYGCLIDLLGRAGQFDEAFKVVSGMKIVPDEVVWGSLLNGCKIHGRPDLAEFAVKKLIEIDPNNGGYIAMLATLYGAMGKWDEARELRKMLMEQNAYKTPGCSWIELDNQVHQFYSVDKSHPRTEEIYAVLECLADSY
ncbi:unnamed protein product [Coffea canephora]|uniref:Pentacotripeptide-repeat region of PRORP domain-containing protein n=1 Tax=Coffea canephora TaxID=49390 RepID=A0A068URE2_COFCA|nr:unnamed protein product [Coffea canephora]